MKILIFGTGKFFERNKYNKDIVENEILAFIDNDKNKQGLFVNDKPIISPDKIHYYNYDKIVIMSNAANEIRKQLVELNIPIDKIEIYQDIAYQQKVFFSYFYLKGEGIEIGTLHNPLKVNKEICSVKYIDKKNVNELIKNYPEINHSDLAKVDIIDDGEYLSEILDESQDFIIASHFLEHCKNPILTIKAHLKKLKKNGILYYVVPDKRYTFDKNRKLTTGTIFTMIILIYQTNLSIIMNLLQYILQMKKKSSLLLIDILQKIIVFIFIPGTRIHY
ncbi:MAG TPA: hypothetical protein PLD27_05420 [bacterium]|nr:hypothetical protein [bacterium]HOL47270.1 hypothetical protein [bacterium]HPQ19635.1 hypothetical protein [bacterium]